MQKSVSRGISLLMVGSLLAACDQQGPASPNEVAPERGPSVAARVSTVPASFCGTRSPALLAGQTMNVGTVTLANDAEKLYVSFRTIDGWEMTETHLAVTTDHDLVPNQGKRVAPGQFPDKSDHDPAATVVHYAIPLNEIGLAPGEPAIVAAHADIVRNDVEEGAWIDGAEIREGGSWASYATYDIVECARQDVGSEGGTLVAGGGAVELIVPEDALSEPVEIEITEVPATSLPEGALEGTAYDFEPDGLVFDEPVELRIEYDDTGLSLPEEEALSIHLLDNDVWTRVSTTVDPSTNVLSAWITHFSVYAILPSVGELTLSVSPQPIGEGEVLTHSVALENLSGGLLSNVTVRILAKGLVNSPSAPNFCSAFGINSGPDAPALLFECSFDIGSGATEAFDVSVRAQSGSAGTSIVSHAEFLHGTQSSSTPEITTGIVAAATADLSVAITDSPDPVTAGSTLSYDVSLANAGPDAVTDVTVGFKLYHADPLPEAAVLSSGCSLFGKTVTHYLILCELASLPSGGNHTFQISAKPTETGSLAADAAIDNWTGPSDPDLNNNTDSETTQVEAASVSAADLSVAITDSPDPVTAGSTLSYDVSLANAGPDAVSDVTVGFKLYHADPLPEAAVLSSGCSLFGKTATHYLILCELASLPSGGDHTFQISAKPTETGSLAADASIDSWTGPSDPDLNNNTDSETTQVEPGGTGLSGRLLFHSDRASSGVHDLYIKDLATGTIDRLTTNERVHSPEWSPDGTQVAFSSRQTASSNDYDIQVLTLSNGAMQTVATGIRANEPTWSPDGTRIAYTASDGVTLDWDIHIVTLATLAEETMADSNDTDREPNWSPDGSKIAFTRDDGTSEVMLQVDVSTGVVSSLYANHGQDLQWSPNGSLIAFSQWKSQDPIYEIEILDVSAGTSSQLTSEGTISSAPVWAENSTYILFARRDAATGLYDIYSIPSGGGTPALIESSAADDFTGGWRP